MTEDLEFYKLLALFGRCLATAGARPVCGSTVGESRLPVKASLLGFVVAAQQYLRHWIRVSLTKFNQINTLHFMLRCNIGFPGLKARSHEGFGGIFRLVPPVSYPR